MDIDSSTLNCDTRPGRKRKPGAGRKAGKHGRKSRVTLWLSPDVVEWIHPSGREQAAGPITSASEHVDTALRSSLEFVLWKAKRDRTRDPSLLKSS